MPFWDVVAYTRTLLSIHIQKKRILLIPTQAKVIPTLYTNIAYVLSEYYHDSTVVYPVITHTIFFLTSVESQISHSSVAI